MILNKRIIDGRLVGVPPKRFLIATLRERPYEPPKALTPLLLLPLLHELYCTSATALPYCLTIRIDERLRLLLSARYRLAGLV